MKKIIVPATIKLTGVNGNGVKATKDYSFVEFLTACLDEYKALATGFKGYKKAHEMEEVLKDVVPKRAWIMDKEVYNTLYAAVDEMAWKRAFQLQAKTFFDALLNAEDYKPPNGKVKALESGRKANKRGTKA